jgi:Uma2 family endonuclease
MGRRMKVEEFLAWAEGRPARHELVYGEIVSQSAERAAHLKVKLAAHVALLAGVRARGLPCHVLPDRAAVLIDDETVYESDGSVICGTEPAH